MKFLVNELQLSSINELRKKLEWSHYTNIVVRKDGQNFYFEADWLRNLLNLITVEAYSAEPSFENEDGK